MLTREQRRAQDAYQRVKARRGRPNPKKYGAMAHRLPALIRSAGLALALEFVESRGEDAHRDLLDDLSGTLGFAERQDLLAASRNSPLPEYARLTRGVLAACTWYRRFAESVLGVKPGEEAESGADAEAGW
jgi:CRISPR-associated protein Cmr5